MNDNVISGRQYYRSKIYPKLAFLRNPRSFFYYVLLLIGVGVGFFAFALFTQRFTTPYSGDFSQQGFPFTYNFYDTWWTFFNTGKFPLWDFNVFLGADNIEANTFYGLFSPFMLPILFFPRDFIPQAMALMSIARLVVGGLFFRLYLKYLGASESSARLFSFAYAFMGWTAYYLWFNSFYEVATFFPLVLFGIEKTIREKKIWALSLGLFLLGISNYFFFITAGIFGVLYAGFRFFQTIKTRKAKDSFAVFGLGVLGFAIGFGLTAIVCLPSVMSSFGIDRASRAMYWPNLKESFMNKDWDTFFTLIFNCWNDGPASSLSGYENYYFASKFPLVSFFYPTISCRFVNLIHYRYFENSASSIFIFTPCIIMLFVSLFISGKEKKVSHFLAVIFMAATLFIPFVYFLCGAFSIPYGRWEIVVPMFALTYIALSFDKRHLVPRFVVIIAGGLALIGMIVSYIIATKTIGEFENVLEMGPVIGVVIYEMVLCVAVTVLLTCFWKSKHLPKIVNANLIIEIIVMGTLVANIHSLSDINRTVNGGYNDLPVETRVINNINDNDDSYFRIQSTRAYESNDNIPMVEGYNGVSTFHSFYNNEVDDFQRMSQVLKGDSTWVGTAFAKRTNLDEFLGVKYYVTKDSETTYTYYSNNIATPVTFEPNVPLGFERIDDLEANDGYRVYKNKYHINFATSYDTLYYKHDCANSTNSEFYPYFSIPNIARNEEAYFKGAILNDKDIYEIVSENPETFIEESKAPLLEAQNIGVTKKGVYVNNEENRLRLDPRNPDRDIKPENLLANPESSEISPYYYQIVFEPSGGGYFPIGTEGGYYMLSYPVRSGSSNYNTTIFLIGEDDEGNSKVITFDNNRNCSRDRSSMLRGFYSKEKIKRIIVCPDGDKCVENLTIYYEPFEKCISRYEKAISYGVNNVKNDIDSFTFETNYETTRYVITQVAYHKGWSVFATVNGEKKQLKTYNSQGGFVGFVAPKGNVSYEMTYMTPHIKTGALISAISLFGLGGITALGIYLNKRKQKKVNNE